MDKRVNNGGKRKGAGRKKAPYLTKVVSFRVKEQYVEPVKKIVKNYINKNK